jgi:hypothetical protein
MSLFYMQKISKKPWFYSKILDSTPSLNVQHDRIETLRKLHLELMTKDTIASRNWVDTLGYLSDLDGQIIAFASKTAI